MEVFVNYPKDEEGIKELNKAVAQVHATLVLKAVEDLDISSESKKKVIRTLVQKLKKMQLKKKKKIRKKVSRLPINSYFLLIVERLTVIK